MVDPSQNPFQNATINAIEFCLESFNHLHTKDKTIRQSQEQIENILGNRKKLCEIFRVLQEIKGKNAKNMWNDFKKKHYNTLIELKDFHSIEKSDMIDFLNHGNFNQLEGIDCIRDILNGKNKKCRCVKDGSLIIMR